MNRATAATRLLQRPFPRGRLPVILGGRVLKKSHVRFFSAEAPQNHRFMAALQTHC